MTKIKKKQAIPEDKNSAVRQDYFKHLIASLPQKPGVYRMKDKDGTILYVGKAKNLKSRVSSYFQSQKDMSVKNRSMMKQVADIDHTVVGSDLEAVMMETNLIKELRPKYNILMKDDKNYVYIKITTQEDFPRIFVTRHVANDKARYFGPKTAQHKVMKTLKVLKRIFPFRHCQLAIDWKGISDSLNTPTSNKHAVKVTKANIKYPCIDYHIKRCVGPCVGTVTPQEYKKIIQKVIDFLEGKHDEVLKSLKEEMAQAAAQKKFEVAANIRDKIQAVEDIMEKQRISAPAGVDQDVINYLTEGKEAFFNLFQVRGGKLINQENFTVKSGENLESEDSAQSEILQSFLEQYYEKATDFPKEIIIPHELESQEALEKLLNTLNEKNGPSGRGTIKIIIPERGRKNQLLQLSLENAQSYSKTKEIKWQGKQKGVREQALEKLQTLLRLQKPPRRLECYDISHHGGTETVGSMVVFEKGFPAKDLYRKFKLHQETSGAPDDFASMEETLTRRLKYLKPSLAPDAQELRKVIKECESAVEDKKALIQKIPTLPKGIDLNSVITKLAKKHKVKRIYLSVDPKEKESYEQAGCLPVRKIPDEIQKLAAASQSKKSDGERTARARTSKAAASPMRNEVSLQKEIYVYDTSKHAPDKSFRQKPDLIIIDGGKGQLSAALKAAKKYDLHETIPFISIAKKNEELFLPGSTTPIILPKDSPVLHLIQHIRDEAHRFAVSYHSGLKLKATKASALDTIAGIGEKNKMKLLRHFGSPDAVKNATMHELEKVVGKKSAILIKTAL